MESDHPGGPLDALHAAYLELTAKIEAKVISLDEALEQLQGKEVVDAAGHIWRIDPVTQSFVRRAPGADTPWKLVDPSEFAYRGSQGTSEAGQAPRAAATPTPGNRTTVAAPDIEKEADRTGRRRLLTMVTVALCVVAVAGVLGSLGHRGHSAAATPRAAPPAAATPPAIPQAAATPSAAPTVTQQAAQLSKLELTRYQPTAVKAVPAPQQVVLTWRLPPGAQQDGAGIIIRQQPAASGDGLTVLSPAAGRLPETYVAVPLEHGRQYCFLVGVLLQKVGGSTTLAQSDRVCAEPG